jgi:hypothetical protein
LPHSLLLLLLLCLQHLLQRLGHRQLLLLRILLCLQHWLQRLSCKPRLLLLQLLLWLVWHACCCCQLLLVLLHAIPTTNTKPCHTSNPLCPTTSHPLQLHRLLQPLLGCCPLTTHPSCVGLPLRYHRIKRSAIRPIRPLLLHASQQVRQPWQHLALCLLQPALLLLL